ncbi:MAG: nucleotidyltransferase domain-containing protein [Acidobacteriota bacterium]|nr:nucleotidyltransferase domain-containing protein [Acidobacteriota bacterium]
MGIGNSFVSTESPVSNQYDSSLISSALGDALFTTTQQRVLALLFGQPDRSFFVTEIIGLADLGRGTVQRELCRLAECGLTTVFWVGSQKHYQANRDSPLFRELCSIIRKTVGLKDPVLAALQAVSKQITLALIYGSIAKRQETAASDIDLLVVSDTLTLEAVCTALAPAEKQLDRRVNPMLYTSSEFRRRRASGTGFLTRILQDSHLVLMGSIDGA